MRWQWIARVIVYVLVMIVGTGPAWAQANFPGAIPVKKQATVNVAKINVNDCQGAVSDKIWKTLSKKDKRRLCEPGAYLYTKTNQNEKMGMYGILTIILGTAFAMPAGDQFRIFGDTYCVTDYSVDYGGCGKPKELVIIGLGAVLVGTTMAVIGFSDRHYIVTPTVTKSTSGGVGGGASVTVRW
jgi:hypothetical protein